MGIVHLFALQASGRGHSWPVGQPSPEGLPLAIGFLIMAVIVIASFFFPLKQVKV